MTSASAVSAALRRGGLNPVAASDRSREGVRVRTSVAQTVRVFVDVDAPGAAKRLAADVAEILTEAGYRFVRDGLYFTVTGR